MRKLFLSLIITLGAFAAPNVWADLDTGGTTLDATEAGKAKLQQIMTSICSANGTAKNSTIKTSVSKTDAGYVEPGTVFFVDMNSHWIGSYENYTVYEEINEGVKDVIQVKDDSKKVTSTGTFYTHEAKNANKFFFIVRRNSMRNINNGTKKLAFLWYDEWSYVENTSNGYEELQPSLNELIDGAPFFSPHNCATSLENNHYITLNKKDDYKSSGYDFTVFLYIPNNAPTSGDATKTSVGTGEYEYKEKTIYVDPVYGGKNGTFYVKNNDGTYTAQEFYYYTNGFRGGTETTVYERKEITVQAYTNAPYMFFYTVDLSGKRSDKKTVTGYDCPYDAILDWTTAFDKWKKETPLTKYNGMIEHYILERSYDQITWETVNGVNDVVGDNITDGTKKTFTDTELKDFDATTAKIGYTVYYRLTSVILKEDDNGKTVEMARRLAKDIVIINIPGTSPFSLTLKDKTKSEYVPGSVDESGEYTDGKNIFTNTIISAETEEHDAVTLKAGAKLELVRTDAKGSKTVSEFTVVDATMSLSDLAKQIGTNGVFTESFETAPGDAIDATYQLRLTIPETSEVILSNIVNIVGSKVSNTSESVHRSGTPDAATCAEKELFRNEVKFKPANTGIGTGYYIYCNGTKVLTLRDGGSLKFKAKETGKEYVEAADGTLSVTLFEENTPIAVGELGKTSETPTSFHYAVVHYDEVSGNTYGSAAAASVYSGAKEELVVTFNNPSATLIKSYYYVIMRPVVTWKLNKSEWDDVASPIRYEVYLKQEQAEFEKTDNDAYKGLDSSVDTNEFPFGEYKLRTTIEKDSQGNLSTSFYDDIYYARKNQYAGSWVNPIAAEEIRPISYYVKAIYKYEYNETERNKAEKNSDVYEVTVTPGGIFTDIEGVSAEGVSVEANDGVITVAGASGTIVVYSATGQAVATAQGDGGVTTIDASNLNGVYIVKANNMKPTKILIK